MRRLITESMPSPQNLQNTDHELQMRLRNCFPVNNTSSPLNFWLWPPQFGSIFGSSRTKPSFWILKALPPRSPDQVLLRELRSMEALGEIKRK